jgi:hypothetical protein
LSGLGAFAGTFYVTSYIEFALIRIPIDLDAWTWNNAYYKTRHMSGGLSTLYATADNFEYFNYPRLAGKNTGFATPQDTGAIIQTDSEPDFLKAALSDLDPAYYPNLDKANNGPFYGMAAFFNPIFRGGFFQDPTAGVTAELRSDITVIDDTADAARAFILEDDLGVVNA